MVLDGNLKRGRPILAKAYKVGREPAPHPSASSQDRPQRWSPRSGVISFSSAVAEAVDELWKNGDRVARMYPSCKGNKLNP